VSVCTPCKRAADETADRRERGNGMVRLHACAYPHTCTCQHDRSRPVRLEALVPEGEDW
jgi:hypothetical protein